MTSKPNLSKYKAIILAGGKGTRLYPITLYIPKPLLPVGSKPMINYAIDCLNKQGVRNIAVLINQSHKKDFDWWKKRYYPLVGKNKPRIIIFEEKSPLGTFGGLWYLKKWIGKNRFFLLNADDLTDLNLYKLANFAEKNNFTGSLALVKVSDPKDYGVVLCEGKAVREFIEKPENPISNYVNSGWYLLSPKIFDYHPGPNFLMIEKDIFPLLVRKRELGGFNFIGRWIDCGTWEKYEKAIEIFGKEKRPH